MRTTSSAAIALTLALLISPLASLVCVWPCAPTPEAVTAASETCHRAEADDSTSATVALRALPHDCRTHDGTAPIIAATPARQSGLDAPRIAAGPIAAAATGRSLPASDSMAAHDPAPSGVTPGLLVPLRL